VQALRERALALERAGGLRAAAVGRGSARSERGDIRGDRISWLEAETAHPAELAFFAQIEALRLAFNRQITLGLFEFEGHYALYPRGASYARHRDRFRDDDARVISCVAYLNDGWHDDEGGALRLYLEKEKTRDIMPVGGTLVAFLSDRFEHAVLPARRERLAVTGWFRRRSASVRPIAGGHPAGRA
jgi:SM-20-related protein